MSSRVRTGLAALALAAALAATPASAGASFGGAALVSSSPTLLTDYAYNSATAGGGGYVAFVGSVASVPGVYRKNLLTGALDLVAGHDAGAPSISADGRYVSFTTSTDPLGGNPLGCSQVYVRDMGTPITAADAYTLASALDQSSQALTYAGSGQSGCPGGGAAAADRVALSSDGRRVAFTVIGRSNLTGAVDQTDTPPNQIAVRDLDTQRTTLVSVTRASLAGAPQPVPGGAAISAGILEHNVSVGISQVDLPISASTAALSPDGTTVAWLGVNIPDQAPVTPAPADGQDHAQDGFVNGPNDYAGEYVEPLWRRLADGSAAPTRRILGGDDPLAPGCPPACSGPLDLAWDPVAANLLTGGATTTSVFGSIIGVGGTSSTPFTDLLDAWTPQLSGDGQKVAVLSSAPSYGSEPDFGLGGLQSAGNTNLFVVDMRPGLSRAQALTRLTDWASIDFRNAALAGNIDDLTIAPDGSRVAFVTQRVAFPLAPPALITPPPSRSGTQLYEADLRAGTLALVSNGYDGQPADGSIQSPSFSADGNTLTFASSADNLVYGAVNQGSNTFVIRQFATATVAGQQSVAAPLPNAPVLPEWRISATVRPGPDGSLLLDASVPGAGMLSARATRTTAAVAAGASRRSHKASRRRPRKARTSNSSLLALAHTTASSAGVFELRLKPASRYLSLIRSHDGLYATITISFTAARHAALTQKLAGSFHQLVQASQAKRKHRPAKARRKTAQARRR
jgi:WD40-like Beta Propeller Repeat